MECPWTLIQEINGRVTASVDVLYPRMPTTYPHKRRPQLSGPLARRSVWSTRKRVSGAHATGDRARVLPGLAHPETARLSDSRPLPATPRRPRHRHALTPVIVVTIFRSSTVQRLGQGHVDHEIWARTMGQTPGRNVLLRLVGTNSSPPRTDVRTPVGQICVAIEPCGLLMLSVVQDGTAYMPFLLEGAGASGGAVLGSRVNAIVEGSHVEIDASAAEMASELSDFAQSAGKAPFDTVRKGSARTSSPSWGARCAPATPRSSAPTSSTWSSRAAGQPGGGHRTTRFGHRHRHPGVPGAVRRDHAEQHRGSVGVLFGDPGEPVRRSVRGPGRRPLRRPADHRGAVTAVVDSGGERMVCGCG